MKHLTCIDFENNEYLLLDYVTDNKFKTIEIHKTQSYNIRYQMQVKIDLVLQALQQLKIDQKISIQYAYSMQDDQETGLRFFIFA